MKIGFYYTGTRWTSGWASGWAWGIVGAFDIPQCSTCFAYHYEGKKCLPSSLQTIGKWLEDYIMRKCQFKEWTNQIHRLIYQSGPNLDEFEKIIKRAEERSHELRTGLTLPWVSTFIKY